MPHRSRDLKSKTKSLRLNFGTWRRTDLKKNQWFDNEEPMIWRWRRIEERSDNEEGNDLTKKNWGTIWRQRTVTMNRSEWVIGWSKSNLHEELRRSWGRRSETWVRFWVTGCRWEETRIFGCRWVFCHRWDVLFSANGFSGVCACLRLGFVCLGVRVFWSLRRWVFWCLCLSQVGVCMFRCESVLEFGCWSGEIWSQIEF